MTTTRFPLEEQAFRKWFDQKPPDTIIGKCQSSGHCLIASYLQETYGHEFAVKCVEMPRDAFYHLIVDYTSKTPLPGWAQLLAVRFDELGTYAQPITKDEFEAALFKQQFERFSSMPTGLEQEATLWLESLSDTDLERLWERLGDYPVYDQDAVNEMIANGDYDLPTDGMENDQLDEAFVIWPRGTARMEMWEWFDDQHSQGIGALMYEDHD